MKQKDVENLLLNQRWKLYLERQQPLFTMASFIDPYTSLLEKVTGFGFSRMLFLYSQNTCFWYLLEDELKKADQYYFNLISKNNSRLQKWLKLGIKLNQEADNLIKMHSLKAKPPQVEKDFTNVFDKVQNIFLYGTVIPYRVFSALNSVSVNGQIPQKYKAIYDTFKPLRETTKYPQITFTVFRQFWKQASEITGVKPYSLFAYAIPAELKNIFIKNKNIDPAILRQRRESIFWLEKNGGVCFDYSRTLLKKFQNTTTKKNPRITKIKGQVVYKGIVRGKAKIINTIQDMKGFQKNDIIISVNTSPALLPAIRICGGIVTDEGGIMCHAAIISRELKKPCIIGTKIATKSINNGSFIEIDGESGTVKIL